MSNGVHPCPGAGFAPRGRLAYGRPTLRPRKQGDGNGYIPPAGFRPMTTRAAAAARRVMEPLLTIADLADLAGLSDKTIRRKIAEGEIQVVRIGPNAIRIRPEEARRFLRDPDSMEEPNEEV